MVLQDIGRSLAAAVRSARSSARSDRRGAHQRSQIRGAVCHSQPLVDCRGWRGECECVWRRDERRGREKGWWWWEEGSVTQDCARVWRERERRTIWLSAVVRLVRWISRRLNWCNNDAVDWFIQSLLIRALLADPRWLTAWRVAQRS